MKVDQLEATIVAEAFEGGRLGSLEEVKKDMDPYFTRSNGVKIGFPFDSSGHLIEYSKMSNDQVASFNLWHRRSEKVTDVVGPEIDRAEKDLLHTQTSRGR
jgi:hypothetical protein